MRPPTKGRVLKERVWCFVEALLTRAEDSFDFEVHWEDENTDRPKFVVKTRRRFLEAVAELKQSQIYEVINSLKGLELLEDRRFKQKRGSDQWCFALKLWSRDAQRNREQFERIWEGSRTEKSKALEATYNKSKDSAEVSQDEIDWHNICRTMLEKQKRLTTNELLSADEDMKFELDEIHVPLALVQRTKPDKRSGDVFPEQGSRLYEPSYEEKQRFKHEDFLAQVLQQGKGQSKGRRIALIGEPGAGKTTLLQAIAFWLLEDKNKDLGLPIWISLADLQGKTLEEYLLQRWLKNALEVVRVTSEQENALVELFKNNRVWLLLDGVDEIVAGSVGVGAQGFAPLQIIASHLEGWVAKARVVLSCRLNVWEANINALGDDFDKYRLLDFDYPEQVKEFIDRWFAKTDSDKGERLWAELDKSERQRIQDLVKNPLRLALLCSTYDPDPPSPPYQGGSKESFSSHQGESNESLSSEQGITKDSLISPPYQGGARGGNSGLPNTKAGLYQRFLKEFYKWKENRFPTTEEQQEELNAALGRLAKRAIDQEASRFRLRHKLVREELGDPKQQGSLFWLALQLGWLNQVGLAAESEEKEEVYAFFHPTFQEYFAALAIDDWNFFLNHVPHNPAQGIYRIFEPQWKEVILLWLGHKKVAKEEKEEFIKALLEFEDGCGKFYNFQAFFLASAGISEFSGCSHADKIVVLLVAWVFGYFEVELKLPSRLLLRLAQIARVVLIETDRTRVTDALTQLLNSQNERNKCQAALILLLEYDSKNLKVIGTLTELLNSSQDEQILGAAALGLLKCEPKHSKAIDTLSTLSDRLGRQRDDDITKLLYWSQMNYGLTAKHLYGIQFPLEGYSTRKSILGTLYSPQQDAVEKLEQDRSFSVPIASHEIDTLLHLLRTSEDMDACCQAIYRLRVIDEYGTKSYAVNPDEITALTELVNRSGNLCSNLTSTWQLVRCVVSRLRDFGEIILDALKKSASNDVDPIKTLIEVVVEALIEVVIDCNSTQPDYYSTAVFYLGIIGAGKLDAVRVLIEVVHSCRDENTRVQAISCLNEMLRGNLFQLVVTGLKCYLQEPADETERSLRDHCYEVIWHCARKMTYPAFYQAWHQQEGVGKTTTLDRQSLNQADLPQSLQSAIANDPQLSPTIHLICIDGSQFIERDRPTAKIYTQMVKGGCPKCDDGTPKTMTELQTYWDLLGIEFDKRVVLVFYASSTDATPDEGTTLSCPYNEAFLTALSKFGREICVITGQRFDHIPLKCFTPSQSIADIVEWMRGMVGIAC